MPPKSLATDDYTPSFAGFTIQEYTDPSYADAASLALPDLPYVSSGTPCSTEYNAHYIYRLALQVEYPVGKVDPTTFPPSVFAILYSGTQRKDNTMVLPLVPAGISPDNTTPLSSMEYNADMSGQNPSIRIDNMIGMQQQDPSSPNYYYGFLQLDYHCQDITYEIGIHTIELMLGWGPVKAQPNQWTDPITCQWQITPPSSTPTTATAQKKGKTAGVRKIRC